MATAGYLVEHIDECVCVGVWGSFPGQVMASVSRNVSVKKLELPKREIFDQVSRGLNLSSCLKMQNYLDSSFENSPCSLVLSRSSSRKTLIVVAIFQCSKYSNVPNIISY